MQPVAASERFSVLTLGAGQQHNRAVYQCHSCGFNTAFTAKDFARSMFNDNSVLGMERIEAIENIQPFVRGSWEEFHDFECKGCGAAVRLIFFPNEYRMGCHYYRLKEVIELGSQPS